MQKLFTLMKRLFPFLLALISFTAQAQLSNIDFSKANTNGSTGSVSSETAVLKCNIFYDFLGGTPEDQVSIVNFFRPVISGRISKISTLESISTESIFLDYWKTDDGWQLNVFGSDGKKIATYRNLPNENPSKPVSNQLLNDAAVIAKINNQKQDLQNTYRNDSERTAQFAYEMQFYMTERKRHENTTAVFSVNTPRYTQGNMVNHTLDRVELTKTEIILYFTFTGRIGSKRVLLSMIDFEKSNVYSTFNLHKSATLKTGTGKEVNLLRCEGLRYDISPFYGSDYLKQEGNDYAYYSNIRDNVTKWQAVFPRIDADAATIDFDENFGSKGYYIHGIQLK